MDLRLVSAEGEALRRVSALYEEAFPAPERKPFEMLLDKRAMGQVEILAIQGQAGFCGLAITALDKDLALLDYFAVDRARRGQGTGGRALQLIGQRYGDKRLFLEIEQPHPQAENQAQRLKRLAFYERCGYRPMGLNVALNGVDMMLLSRGQRVGFDEYRGMYERVYGADMARLVVLREEMA